LSALINYKIKLVGDAEKENCSSWSRINMDTYFWKRKKKMEVIILN
jgi:hypothetical protein